MSGVWVLERLLSLLLISGIFFWFSFAFSAHSQRVTAAGWHWLAWRPLPHDLPRSLLTGFFLGFLLQTAFALLLRQGNAAARLPVGVMVLFSILFFQGLLSLLLVWHLHRARLDPMRVLGMEEPLRARDLIWGLAGYCMCLAPVGAATLLSRGIFGALELDFGPQPMIAHLGEARGWLNWLSIFLLIGFIGPMLEEVIFRGFLFTWLRQHLGGAAGLLLQALIFALIHAHVASFAGLFALSMVLGFAYLYTRRLMVCVWAHAIFNCATLLHTWLTLRGGAT